MSLHEYVVSVRDPQDDGPAVIYRFKDHNPGAAEASARAAYTGLLGVPEGLRERLEVKVYDVEKL